MTARSASMPTSFYLLLLGILVVPNVVTACNIPPDFWCDSVEAAQRCGVSHQCESFKRDRRPVKLTLMYEALCPYCQKFITHQLGNIYNQFQNVMELELVPWGNSRLMRNGQISCNHGQKECDANKLMSCVIDAVKVKQALPFIVCLERELARNNVEYAFSHCNGFVRNHYRNIRQCFDGERGRQLQRQAAHRTASVRANPILEVPYLVYNDYSPNMDANAISTLALPQLLQKWKTYKRL
uniref:Saposin A-type domain-containing protein n=1 Tax=Steinernema glaseri TaxID=37863 RepID=A0A1I8AVV2_9BILA